MKCSNCGSSNAANTKFCTNCGAKLDEGAKVVETTSSVPAQESSGIGWGFLGFFIPLVGIILFFVWKSEKPKSSKAAGIGALISIILSLIIIVFTFAILGASFGAIMNSPEVKETIKESINETTDEINENKSNKYTIGDTFKFGDFEITIDKTYTVETFNDEYYESKNGKKVIKMPITIKNNGNETQSLNSYYLKYFGPSGTQQELDFAYDYDDGIGMAGDLRSGASYTKYLYYEYEGVGNYTIEFDDYTNKVEVNFKITE